MVSIATAPQENIPEIRGYEGRQREAALPPVSKQPRRVAQWKSADPNVPGDHNKRWPSTAETLPNSIA